MTRPKDEEAIDIVARLLKKDGCTVPELATAAECDVRTIYRYIQELEDRGELVYRIGSSRPTQYRIEV